MGYDIVIADPANNITVFVLTPVPPAERAEAARALLSDPSLKAEQVGFVVPPPQDVGSGSRPDAPLRPDVPLRPGAPLWRGATLWRLDMMGGEFCGNAARSFGLYVARQAGLSGKVCLEVEISGTPVMVRADLERGLAEASMPPVIAQGTLAWGGADLPVYLFEGIAHVIAPDVAPSASAFYAIKALLETALPGAASSRGMSFPGTGAEIDALGVMFWDARVMTPAVYVRGTDTLVFESSCGSGSAALGLHLTRGMEEGEELLAVKQSGGVIEVRVEKRPGEAAALSIGGPVALSRPERWP
jgi:diaminopimelate epimerase